MKTPPAVFLIYATTIAACDTSGTPASDWQGSMADSAGVTWVENTGSGQEDEPQTPETDLVIGVADGDEDYTFGRIADVAMGRRGQIFVADELAHEVRVYDSLGAFVRRVGRSGDGPGEFGRVLTAVLITPADTLYVPDYWNKRINVYAPSGAFVRTIHLSADLESWAVSWALDEQRGPLFRGMTIGFDDARRYQTWEGIMQVQSDTLLDTLLVLDYARPDIGTAAQLRIHMITNSVFWDRLDDGRIAWSSLDQDRLFIHSADGALERVVTHYGWEVNPATSSDEAALATLYRGRYDLADDAPIPSHVVMPETMPAIISVRAAPGGGFWVQRMGDAASIDPEVLGQPVRSDWLGGTTWDVFDSEGRFQRQVRVPDRFRVTRITETSAIGVLKDDLDVERVVRLRLEVPRERGGIPLTTG
jgi:hypothetical protein